MHNHNMFQVSLLDHYTPLTIGQPPAGPQADIIDDSEEWVVDRIFLLQTTLPEIPISSPVGWLHPCTHELGTRGKS